jgi:hypothetical protein
MSWISSWWRGFLKKGFSFSWGRDWPGDEKLPNRDCWPKTIEKSEVEQEIRDSLNKDIKKTI